MLSFTTSLESELEMAFWQHSLYDAAKQHARQRKSKSKQRKCDSSHVIHPLNPATFRLGCWPISAKAKVKSHKWFYKGHACFT